MMNNNTPTRRDLMTRAFLPDNGLLRQRISRETLNGYADMLLGKGKYSRVPIPGSQHFPEIRTRVDMKKYDLASVCYRYARMFELCRVIGVRHIYDIGCQTQSGIFALRLHGHALYRYSERRLLPERLAGRGYEGRELQRTRNRGAARTVLRRADPFYSRTLSGFPA